MNKSDAGCCSCGSGCCGQEQEKRQIIIEFLYLDLSVCKRCQGTETIVWNTKPSCTCYHCRGSNRSACYVDISKDSE